MAIYSFQLSFAEQGASLLTSPEHSIVWLQRCALDSGHTLSSKPVVSPISWVWSLLDPLTSSSWGSELSNLIFAQSWTKPYLLQTFAFPSLWYLGLSLQSLQLQELRRLLSSSWSLLSTSVQIASLNSISNVHFPSEAKYSFYSLVVASCTGLTDSLPSMMKFHQSQLIRMIPLLTFWRNDM